MIKPYTFSPALFPQEKKFNKALSSAQIVVEWSFGVCKARWRCLLKQFDNCIENVSNVIITGFPLHKICQWNGENYFDDDGILDKLIENERKAENEEDLKTMMLIPIVKKLEMPWNCI